MATVEGARYASSTDHKIYTSDGTSLTPETLSNGAHFLNKADNFIYVLDGSVFIKAGNSGAAAFTTEIHTLTAAEVSAKSFTLSNSIDIGQETNMLCFVQGIAQASGIDFTASGNSISWNNKALDSVRLVAGDTFLLHYIKA